MASSVKRVLDLAGAEKVTTARAADMIAERRFRKGTK